MASLAVKPSTLNIILDSSITIGSKFKTTDIVNGGYLNKRARNSGLNWRRRYFVFDEKNSTLAYFMDKGIASHGIIKALGSVLLTDTASIISVGLRQNCLEIHPGGYDDKPLFVQTPDPKQLLLWKLRLHNFIHPIKSGYLEKRARKSGRNWKMRYFVLDLTTGFLRVFENHKLDHVSTVQILDRSFEVQRSGLRPHCIEVRAGDAKKQHPKSPPSLWGLESSASVNSYKITEGDKMRIRSASLAGQDEEIGSLLGNSFVEEKKHRRGSSTLFEPNKEVIVLSGSKLKGLALINRDLGNGMFEVVFQKTKKIVKVKKKDMFRHKAVDFNFTLGKRLGKGAFATVYAGMNHSTGALIAIKKMKLKFGDKARDMIQAIMDEVRLLKELSHENIVKFLGTDYNITDKSMYILMEQVSGGSLESALLSFGKFSESVIFSYTKHILKGLAYLHSQRVIHRDLKCANVLLSTAGVVKLADFGVSKKIKDIQEDMKDQESCVGSPYWMAPEVILYQGYDTSCDVWSLGCTIIEMATACHPWMDYDNPLSCCYAIGQSEKLPSYPRDMSSHLKDLVLTCLNRDKKKRPSCSELMLHNSFTIEDRRRTNRPENMRGHGARPSRRATPSGSLAESSRGKTRVDRSARDRESAPN
ncbi:hypothetical protein AAMO2058_000210000 [Amorphochlora amoebiformis]